MIRIHKEGYATLTSIFITLMLVVIAVYYLLPGAFFIAIPLSLLIFLFFLQFFRNPQRLIPECDDCIISPADGTVVVIEKTTENEYFEDERIQVSIFMSPLDVHINRIPFDGKVKYTRYHPGKYMVAWHPKSSELNERNTIVLEDTAGRPVLLRQIAGAVARRIVSYIDTGEEVEKGRELGFIKFGSRMDIFLPVDCKINVKLDQKVKGGETIIGSFD
jgi:phosphatidylserine decarboxylase